ncbi:MAG TPA: hypothetical protein VNK43_03615 [Gemmatimonadales bacterium]|nr:hypothetical protein [Gemmatimonadales bacterium]
MTGGRQASAGREARLRPEYAALYPTVTPGVWEPAGDIALRVLLQLIQQGRMASVRDRILNDEHFEFRGRGPPAERTDEHARADDFLAGVSAAEHALALSRREEHRVIDVGEWRVVLAMALVTGWEPPESASYFPAPRASGLAQALERVLDLLEGRGIRDLPRLHDPDGLIRFLQGGAFTVSYIG